LFLGYYIGFQVLDILKKPKNLIGKIPKLLQEKTLKARTGHLMMYGRTPNISSMSKASSTEEQLFFEERKRD